MAWILESHAAAFKPVLPFADGTSVVEFLNPRCVALDVAARTLAQRREMLSRFLKGRTMRRIGTPNGTGSVSRHREKAPLPIVGEGPGEGNECAVPLTPQPPPRMREGGFSLFPSAVRGICRRQPSPDFGGCTQCTCSLQRVPEGE